MTTCRCLILAGLAVAGLSAGAAAGEPSACGDARAVERLLHGSYGEFKISAGLQQNGELLQIFASPDTGSWTAVTTSPQGVSCVLATGRRWVDAPGKANPGPPAS